MSRWNMERAYKFQEMGLLMASAGLGGSLARLLAESALHATVYTGVIIQLVGAVIGMALFFGFVSWFNLWRSKPWVLYAIAVVIVVLYLAILVIWR